MTAPAIRLGSGRATALVVVGEAATAMAMAVAALAATAVLADEAARRRRRPGRPVQAVTSRHRGRRTFHRLSSPHRGRPRPRALPPRSPCSAEGVLQRMLVGKRVLSRRCPEEPAQPHALLVHEAMNVVSTAPAASRSLLFLSAPSGLMPGLVERYSAKDCLLISSSSAQ